MIRHRLLRARPDHRGPGRRSRLERAILRIHGLVLLAFALVALAPLAGTEARTPGELTVRLLLAATLVLVALHLQRVGERPVQLLALAIGLGLGMLLDLWPMPGDITTGLAHTAFAISCARLLRIGVFAVALVASSGIYAAGRLLVSDAGMPPAMVVDSALLTAALTISLAFFVSSLEDRTRAAESLDQHALAREHELHRQHSLEAAVSAAGRVLHDDVLTALRLVGDADPADPPDPAVVRRACRDAIASVREVAGP